ncbi:FkbM family methyltransferase [Curtobacterium ammoniigenes]|uniref:FkbM family methyltransferase n=1 Tax=Curtobacterium ammoniigenes TaxID=395387 RepID=UPI0009FA16EF|nr:FkbM family methyltransferase [Curtobacterium ammoniigenes]
MNASDELDRLWAMPHGQPTSTELLGWEMRIADGPSFVSQYREIFVSEAYSFPSSSDSPTIVDGGANVGMASLWWLARWPNARIVAFEPDPSIFSILGFNLRHHPSDRVELRRAALSTERLGGRFVPDGADGGRLTASSVNRGSAELSVPTQSLQELLRNLEHVDLLKLDIEGAETDVLQESASELARVERLFVEYHSFAGVPQQLPDLIGLLRDNGLRIYIESPMASIRPFETVPKSESADLQLNIWAYRE